MMKNLYEPMEPTETEIRRSARAQEELSQQLAALLSIPLEQLVAQEQQSVAEKGQRYVQQQIRILRQETSQEVTEEQLLQALRTLRRVDVTNPRLATISASIDDITILLSQHNASVQKALNRLTPKSRELVENGLEALTHGWYGDAALFFTRALDQNPRSALVHYYLGKSRAKVGQPLEARQAYEKCHYYARNDAPLFQGLALCDLAALATCAKNLGDARRLLDRARTCRELENAVFAATQLTCDLAENTLSSRTCEAIAAAFADEAVDLEVFHEWLRIKTATVDSDKVKPLLETASRSWREAFRLALYDRLVSALTRELSDHAYLAPRFRRGFTETADGKFLLLGESLAEILDWTATIAASLLNRSSLFPHDYPAVLRCYRPLQDWNRMLIRFNQLTCLLAATSARSGDPLVEKTAVSQLESLRKNPDDRIVLEVNCAEGDLLALSCYYAFFIRPGVAPISVPLHAFATLRLERYPAGPGSCGVLITDPRTSRTLLQGTTGCFTSNGASTGDVQNQFDAFVELASVLAEIHECLQWASAHEHELFSVLLALSAVADRLQGQRQLQARPQPGVRSNSAPMRMGGAAAPVGNHGGPGGNDALPDQWHIASGQQRLGPVTWRQLQEMAASGKLQAGDRVLQEGATIWSAAGSLLGLFRSAGPVLGQKPLT